MSVQSGRREDCHPVSHAKFEAHSKLRDKEQFMADGWIQRGAYCPNGCYEELATYKKT